MDLIKNTVSVYGFNVTFNNISVISWRSVLLMLLSIASSAPRHERGSNFQKKKNITEK